MNIFTHVIWLHLFLLVMKGNAQSFIIKGRDNLVDTTVVSRLFNFGTDWRGSAGSTIRIMFELNTGVVDQFGERVETFSFTPEGLSTPVDIIFDIFPTNRVPPFVFPLSSETSSLVCGSVTKLQGSTNEFVITSGTPSCNGQYTYIVTIGQAVDTATSTIQFSGGTPPNFLELNQVTSTSTNTFYGLLGTTFQTTTDRTQTVRINATDIIGQPSRGNIQWFFTAQGSTGRIPLPGSLVGVTIETPQTGTSVLNIREITSVHLGEYTAVATNDEGTDTASAFITEGVVPFIIQGSGQSTTSDFRVGANRTITPGDTVRIQAEDRQSNPSAITTWSYSSNASGTFAPISDGGAYSILETSTGNIGIDSTLTITNAQEAQYGYYRAEAINAFGTSTSTTSLVGRSPGVRRGSGVISEGGTADIGASFTGATGSTVTIIAEDINGFPESSYRWQRIASNGVITNIASGGRFSIVESTVNGRLRSTLTITGVRREELGIYRVRASNGLTPDDIVESLVGIGSTCRSGTTVTRVSNGGAYESAGYFDTTNVNSFALQAADTSGVPTGTVAWTYSRTRSGSRSALGTGSTSVSGGTINFFNLIDAALGYYFPRITNDFDSQECVNLVGNRLGFATGSGQIGQDSSVQSGNRVEITARFVRGFPRGPITWRDQNSNTITSATPGYTVTGSSDRSTLTILSASESNSGRYTASSSNVFGDVTESSNVAITTNIIAPTIDKGSPTTINTDGEGRIGELFKASIGDVITIAANDATGVEESVISWSRIPPGERDFVEITSGSTFTIRSDENAQGFTESSLIFIVGSNTFGTYRAEASNGAGRDDSSSVVGQAPRIVGTFTSIGIDAGESRTVEVGGQVDIKAGGTINLRVADLEGQPDRSFVWFYRNTVDGPFEPLPAFSNIGRLVNGNVGMLVINSLFGSQHGQYRVQATNDFGESINVTTTVGGPPIIRVLTGVETDGSGEIGQDIQIPESNRLRITACIIGGFPPANVFQFREEDTNLNSVQQDPPNDNCYVYEEGEFEITCETTISARASNNEFGFGNEPMSRITFPAPRIIRSSAKCNEGSTQSSFQIGDQLCLYNLNSFDITCSVERVNIPEFNFQWQYKGRDIGNNTSGQYTIVNRASMLSSRLTVLNAGVNEVGRYACSVTSTCGETDAVNSDVEHYSYRYFCDENEALICAQSINGGPGTTVFSSVCERFGLERPVCARCNWEMSPWSSCSDQTCHRGRRTRTVQCVCDGEDREDIDCARRSPRPASLDQCGPRVRCNRPFEWRAYQFGSCSATCGVAYRRRRVECVSSITGNVVSDQDCVTLFKPRTINRCLTGPCSDCVDQLPSEDCREVIALMGGDCSKYFLRFDCCATCATFA